MRACGYRSQMAPNLQRYLPSVDRLSERIRVGHPAWPDALLTVIARDVVASVRADIAAGLFDDKRGSPSEEAGDAGQKAVEDAITERLNASGRQLVAPQLQPVLNGTGVLIHTNAGRSPLSTSAIAAITDTAQGYCNLEFNLSDGKRGSRQNHLRDLLRWTTGAADALVVNNNAAAVMLALHAFAQGRPVLVSRGELVEIGGSFRVPDVMTAAGARLVEVGTTNRTWVKDYEVAARELTKRGDPPAALMQVHRSNFRQEGFVATPTVAELAALAQAIGVPLIVDLGSGALGDPAAMGLAAEPTVADTLAAGADIATFSGDKLVGGPQAGILVGSRRWIGALKGSAMARAVRVCSLTVAALQQTLRSHLLDQARLEVPLFRAARMPLDDVQKAADSLAAHLAKAPNIRAKSEPCTARVGGGSQPQEDLPSVAVTLRSDQWTAAQLARRLRNAEPPVLARTQGDRVWLDLRSLLCAADPDAALQVAKQAVAAALVADDVR